MLRDIADACATRDLPPRPSISADAPATTRRCTSFRCGNTTSKNRASPSGVTSTPTHYNARTIQRGTLIDQMTQTRLVFESNKLESAGLPLADTDVALRAAPVEFDQLRRYVAEQAVRADQHLVEVLGLHEATQFARRLADDFAHDLMPIRETDVRSLHQMTVPTERFAGRYRRIEVGIGGSEHQPPSVLDVPQQMSELVAWTNAASAPPALAASVVHSWLTIIHPFEDGNGRVARLLANIVLLRANWSALIVRASDRLQYLDALASSDGGGDLLPLFDLFVKSIKRTLRELETPALAGKLFTADLQRDPDKRYDLWWRELDEFLNELRAQLGPNGVYVDRLSVPPASVFQLLEQGDSAGNTWLAKFCSRDKR